MKILWVKAGGLVPLDTGGKIRSYHILRALAAGHKVTLFTFYAEHANDIHGELNQTFSSVIRHPLRLPDQKSVSGVARYARQLFSRQPHQIGRYCVPQVAASLRQLVERARFDVIVCDFLVAAGVIPWQFPCPKILFTHNVEAVIWKRHFEVARNPFWKALCWREYQTTARAERRYLNLADHVLTVSKTDRDAFARMMDPAKITVIPTGVDVSFFQPAVAAEQQDTLVFTGSMDWMPNEDAIFYFVNEIFPRIRRQNQSVSLVVVGRRPSQKLVDLAKATEGLEVTGGVEDIRPYVHRGALYIVPLRVGGGTRLKIFEAMAMGKAVVSTSIGAEGLPVRHGRDIMIADAPAEFANAVVELLGNPSRRADLGREAHELVTRQYSWESVGRDFESVLESVVKDRRQTVCAPSNSELAGPVVVGAQNE